MPTPRGTRKLKDRDSLLPSPQRPRRPLLPHPYIPRLGVQSEFRSTPRHVRPPRRRVSSPHDHRGLSTISQRYPRNRIPDFSRRDSPSCFIHRDRPPSCRSGYQEYDGLPSYPRDPDCDYFSSASPSSREFHERKSSLRNRSAILRSPTRNQRQRQNGSYDTERSQFLGKRQNSGERGYHGHIDKRAKWICERQQQQMVETSFTAPSTGSAQQPSEKPVADSNRTGVVANYNCEDGFGFITVDTDNAKMKIEANLFVHHTGLKVAILEKGDMVKFDIAQGLKGFEAINVHSNSRDSLETASDDASEGNAHFGEVVDYDLTKRFGVIKCFNGGNTLLAHHSRISPPFTELFSGQLVKFNIVIGPKGPCADHIQPTSDSFQPVEHGEMFQRYASSKSSLDSDDRSSVAAANKSGES